MKKQKTTFQKQLLKKLKKIQIKIKKTTFKKVEQNTNKNQKNNF